MNFGMFYSRREKSVKQTYILRSYLFALIINILTGCGSGGLGGIEGEGIVDAEILPSDPTLIQGGTLQFSLQVYHEDGGSDVTHNNIDWSSSDPAVATIDSLGIATAIAVGTTTINGVIQGHSASTKLTVVAPSLTSVAIEPKDSNIPLGTTLSFTAKGSYSDNTTTDITSSVTWESSNTTIATINESGIATSLSKGTVSISASLHGARDEATLNVSDPVLKSIEVNPQTINLFENTSHTFIATGTYTDKTTQDITTTVNWSSSNAQIASVTNDGQVNAVSGGAATITASLNNISASAIVNVYPVTELATLSVTPASAAIEMGSIQSFSAQAAFSNGSSHDVTQSVTWSLSDTNVGTIDPNGVVTGRKPGTTDVVATIGSTSAKASLTVTAGSLQSISITPSNAIIILNNTLQLSVVGTYADNSQKDLTGITDWLSSNTNVANMDSTGLATSMGQTGLVTITATIDTFTSNTSFAVVAPGLRKTGQTTCYETGGTSIDCAGTGQDGDIQAGKVWPSPRFTSGTGTEAGCITDNLTGLMWVKQTIVDHLAWQDALDYANNLILCGHDDWRMPNLKEMLSLINRGQAGTTAWLSSQGFGALRPSN